MSERDISEKMQDIMERMKNRREELNMSYQTLSEKVGISKSTLQRYETGFIKNMPVDKLEDIAKALNVSPAYLMGWDEPDILVRLDNGEEVLIEVYRKLPHDSQNRLKKYAAMLSNICDLEEPVLKAAHERTDIKVTDEMRKHDDDIMDGDDF